VVPTSNKKTKKTPADKLKKGTNEDKKETTTTHVATTTKTKPPSRKRKNEEQTTVAVKTSSSSSSSSLSSDIDSESSGFKKPSRSKRSSRSKSSSTQPKFPQKLFQEFSINVIDHHCKPVDKSFDINFPTFVWTMLQAVIEHNLKHRLKVEKVLLENTSKSMAQLSDINMLYNIERELSTERHISLNSS